MRRILLALASAILLYIVTLPQALASGNFISSANVTYAIDEDGMTHAKFAIKLENTTSQYYAQVYNLMVGFQTVNNITATDPDGNVEVKFKKKDTSNIISLTLNKKVIGLGKKLPFVITFDTPDVARKMGSIWEINIPGLANQKEFDNFHVHVNIPPSFGKPSYIKPAVIGNTYDFTKEALSQSGISMGFGTEQIYQYSLMYHLENTNFFPTQLTIALPPSTSYQDIILQKLTPKPDNIVQDTDGNWIASYVLLPSKRIDVLAQGQAFLHLHSKPEYITDQERSWYLSEQPYWQVNDSDIKTLAAQLKTPDAIYQYVVNTLTYDYSRISEDQQRSGAVDVLKNPKSAVCLEFTDLFITLARAAGIPAREVDGYAYTQNATDRPLSLVKDILHAWPEYYNESEHRWIMVDPTWQNTTRGIDYFSTMDFDHIVFSIKGTHSDYPTAAGGYKIQGQENKKDVSVDFIPSLVNKTTNIAGNLDLENSILPGNLLNGTLTLTNTGNTAIPTQQLIVKTQHATPHEQTVYIPTIPPMGHVQVPVVFDKQSILTNSSPALTIQLADQNIALTIHVNSFWNRKTIIGGGIIGGIISIGIFIITKRARYLYLQRQRR